MGSQEGFQILAAHIFHHHVLHLALLAIIENTHNVGVLKFSDDLGFAGKALPEVGLGGESQGQDFDSDRRTKSGVGRLVDFSHTATPNKFEISICAEMGLPENLGHAHERNDEVLERIYIGRRFKNDTERLEKLFELYTKMTAAPAKAKPATKATRGKKA